MKSSHRYVTLQNIKVVIIIYCHYYYYYYYYYYHNYHYYFHLLKPTPEMTAFVMETPSRLKRT